MRASSNEILSLRQGGALLLVALATVYVQSNFALHPDVSWLLTLNERLLAGEELYVDLLVVNPAMPIWLYRLPVLLAEATGFRTEWVLHGMIAMTAIASIFVTSHLLANAKIVTRNQAIWLGIALFALLYVLSAYTFAQREFIGLLGFLPWLGLQAWRIKKPNVRPHWSLLLFCGLGCAAMVLVKPHYVLTIFVPVAAICVHQRSVRPVFYIENLVGGVLAAAFAALFVYLHPAFFGEMIGLILSAYAPYKTRFALQFHTFAMVIVLIAIAFRVPMKKWTALTWLLLSAMLGHMLALWIMGRAFPYHVYPAYVFGALTVLEVYRSAQENDKVGPFPLQAGLLYVAIGWTVFSGGAHTGDDFKAYLEQNHAGKSFMPISHSMIDGHPLSRAAGLEFVAPAAFLSMTSYGDQITRDQVDLTPEALERIERAQRYEWENWRASLIEKTPSIVAIPHKFREEKPAAFDAIWRGMLGGEKPADLYRLETTIDGYDIFVPR
ncbi:MAG: hypothetical protein AAFR71_09250 [Pseudomonadota bacterium]